MRLVWTKIWAIIPSNLLVCLKCDLLNIVVQDEWYLLCTVNCLNFKWILLHYLTSEEYKLLLRRFHCRNESNWELDHPVFSLYSWHRLPYYSCFDSLLNKEQSAARIFGPVHWLFFSIQQTKSVKSKRFLTFTGIPILSSNRILTIILTSGDRHIYNTVMKNMISCDEWEWNLIIWHEG